VKSPGARTGLRKASRAGLIAVAIGILSAPGGATAAGGLWAPGPIATAEHAAGVGVELANGEVLVAGGFGSQPVNSSGELLSAGGTAFSPAGSMHTGRAYGAATLLGNGKVLVAGGDSALVNNTPALSSAELWSPAGGGTFTSTGAMHVPRQVFTLTTLPNGEALAVGGSPTFKNSGPAAGSKTAELYSPVTGKWALTGPMPSGRLGHTATLLPSCRVLILGDAHTSVLYNYVTGRFSATGAEGTGLFQRSYQTATVLPNARVLIAGGETAGQVQLNTASVYNPATGKFTSTHNTMSAAHSQGFAALLTDGDVLVGGGFGSGQGVAAADLYDPATNTWSATDSLPPNDYAYSVESALLHNGNVEVIGTASGQASEIYAPTTTGSAHPPAQNCNGLFAVESAATAARGVITLKVGVPFGGSLKGVATVPPQNGVPRTIPYGSTAATPAHSGVFALTINPGSQAKALLKSKGSLKVGVAVTYTPPGKIALHRTKAVTAHWS
jgi:hypothetical protein